MKQANLNKSISSKDAAAHGIVTDKQRLLNSRHWASQLNLFSRRAASSTLLGNTRSRFRGRGMEFEEVRRYQPGDDIRTIDWKVTARNPGTYTKLFCEERERPCHLIIDQRSALFFGSGDRFKAVLAAEISAALAWATIAVGDRVGAQIIGDASEIDIRARNSRKTVLRLIEGVHTFNTQLLDAQLKISAKLKTDHQPNRLSHYLDECLRIIRPGSAVFVISDFHDIDAYCIKALSKISKRADITLFQVFDPLEEQLPQTAVLPISDGLEVAKVRMTGGLRSAYENSIARRENHIRKAAAQSNSHLMKVATTTTAHKALSQVYRT